MLSILILIGIGLFLLTKEKYQNILAKKAASYLSEKLHTRVEIGHVRFKFFNHFNIEDVLVEDEHHDTLAFVGTIQLRTSELLANYWNDQPYVVSDVALKDVFVHLNRLKTGERWNYDFIAEALGSGATDTLNVEPPDADQANKSPTVQFDLKKIDLERIRFFMDDAWRGEDMRFAFNKLQLGIDQLDLNHLDVRIQKLAVDGADILVKEYEGGKPEDLTPDDTTLWGTPFNPDLAKILIQEIELTDSRFRYQDGFEPSSKGLFDERNLDFTGIQANLHQVQVKADTLFADIRQLQVRERCGLEIRNLQAQAKVSQVKSELSGLNLITAHSMLKEYYSMEYRNFHDFNEFIDRVKMNARLRNSSISSLDIGYFANIINQYPIQVHVDGDFEGRLPELSGKNLVIKSSKSSFEGDALVKGLPDINNTYFEVDVKKMLTSGEDLNRLIPQTRVDAIAWKDLKEIRFTGRYEGKVDAFYTKGQLSTSLGTAELDLNMDFKPKVATYKGHVSTKNFQLGRLTRQGTLGVLSADADLDGAGFSLDDLKANIKATIDAFEMNGTVYRKLNINGLVENKKFDGIFVSQDPSLAVNFNGKLDLSGKNPSYDFSSRFIRFNLQKMGLTTEPIIGSGYATLKFKGNNIDDFTGSASFSNLVIEKEDKVVRLDKIELQSIQDGPEKTIQLSSSVADATLKGQFKVSDLSDAVLYYLSHYLPEYISKPAKYSPQNFSFEASLKEVDPLLNTFSPDLKGFNGSSVSAQLNTYDQKLTLDLTLPGAGYGQFMVKDLVVVGAGDLQSFELLANSGNLLYNNDVVIPSLQFSSNMSQDTASLSLVTQSMNDLLGEASLNCKATAKDNKLFVEVLPSRINLKTDPWQLYSEQPLVFGDHIEINNFFIESGAQKIKIQSANTATEENLVADLDNLDLLNVSNYANLYDPVWNGRFSGQIRLKNYLKSPVIEAGIHSLNEVRVDQDTVGLVNVSFRYDVEANILQIQEGSGILRGQNLAGIHGTMNGRDSTIQMEANLKETPISFANQFISDYIKNLKGNATGKVSIKGNLANPKITGSIHVDDASLKVLFLGTTYSIPSMDFSFNNQNIEIEKTMVYDERNGKYSALLSGNLAHRNFSDFYLNFKMKSDNLLCLNTSEYDNSLFYGYVPASVSMNLSGPMNDIDLDIQAKPLKNSKLFLPLNTTGDASTYDYIRFASLGRLQNDTVEEDRNPNYVKINLNIEATPDAEVFLILDQNTGEEIIAKGEGGIRLFVDLGHDITMHGTYTITEGKYLFNFRSLFNKEFLIEEGSKITWSGDILGAMMDVRAIYKTQKSLPLYPLVSNIAESLDESDKTEAKKAYPTYVSILLSGPLSTPKIDFDITQPDNKSVGTAAYSALERIKNDEKELVSQAGVLLLFEQFKAPEGITGSTYGQGVLSTVSDMVSSALSSEITNQFQRLTGLDKVSFNFGYQNIAGLDENSANRNQLSMNISTSLFKDRVVVDFGNSLDIGRNAEGNTTSNFNLGGDFKAQFLITEDGRFRANAFRTNNVNLENTNFTKGGLGLSYKIIYNSFSDLLPNRKRKEIPKQDDADPKSQDGGNHVGM